MTKTKIVLIFALIASLLSVVPCALADNTNLALEPYWWTTANTGFHYGVGGVANVVADNTTKHGVYSSIRIDPIGTTDNAYREANSFPRAVSTGYHIVFSAWIKTSDPATNETDRGARIGLDFYSASGQRITGIQTPDGSPWTLSGGYPSNEDDNFVPWGTSSWTKITMNFYVPSYYESDHLAGGLTLGQHVIPVGVVPWLQVCSSVDGGQAWFSDIELYINPTNAATPAPTTATTTPHPTIVLQSGSMGDLTKPLTVIFGLGFAVVIVFAFYDMRKKDAFGNLVDGLIILVMVGCVGIIGLIYLLGNL